MFDEDIALDKERKSSSGLALFAFVQDAAMKPREINAVPELNGSSCFLFPRSAAHIYCLPKRSTSYPSKMTASGETRGERESPHQILSAKRINTANYYISKDHS